MAGVKVSFSLCQWLDRELEYDPVLAREAYREVCWYFWSCFPPVFFLAFFFFFFKGKRRKLVLFMPQVIIVSWHDLSSQCPWEGTRLRANLSPWRQQSRIKIIGVLRVIIILLTCQFWTHLTLNFFGVCVCAKANLKILIPSLKSFGVHFQNNNV